MSESHEKNLLRFNLVSSLVIITFLALSLGIYGIFIEFRIFNEEMKDIENDYISIEKGKTKNRVENILSYIDNERKELEVEFKNLAINRVREAYKIAHTVYNLKSYNKGENIKDEIKETVKYINWDNKCQVWILDDKCDVVSGPPNKEEKYAATFKTIKNIENNLDKFIYINLQDKLRKDNAHYDYIVYITKFDYFGWYLVSAFDIEQIKNHTIDSLMNLKYGKESQYIIVMKLMDINGGDRFAKMLIGAAGSDLVGKYISDKTKDYQGRYFRKDYLKGLREKGETYSLYSHKKPGGDNTIEKITFFKLYKPWNWIIANGVYLDETNRYIETEKSSFKQTMRKNMAFSISVFLSTIIVAFFIHLSFSRKTNNVFKDYRTEIDFRNIQLEDANIELERQLYVDTLTGLPNKNRFLKDVTELRITTRPMAAVTEIINFSLLNNFYGSTVGDRILQIFTERSKKAIESSELTLYRYQGDNFLFLDKSGDLNKVKTDKLANDFISYIEHKPITIPEYAIEIDLGITIVAMPLSDGFFEKSSIALEEAKKKNTKYIYDYNYSAALQEYENIIASTNLASRALKDDKILPFFQPIVQNGKVTKYECLMRLIDTNGEIISPGIFLNAVKKSKIYNKLSHVMIRKSFLALKDSDTIFSINLAAEDILNNDMRTYIMEMLEKYPVGHKLIFEITESESVYNYEEVKGFIESTKKYGVEFAIDDFGTGYSNFSYLIKLNVDYIKIDGSLIKNIDQDVQSEILVKSIINFAKGLNLKTIAEFVHSESVYKKAELLGIDFFQGYYFGKPLENLIT